MISTQTELVIAEINPELPFVLGANVKHISEFDYIVEGDGYPLNIRAIDDSEDSREIYQAIGGYLSELVEDEATIEVGLGRLNSSAMMYMEPKKDLGVHTEIYGDLLMELTKRGIITNRKKTLYPGVSVCAQLVGSRELFDFADGNQGLNMNSCQQVLNRRFFFGSRALPGRKVHCGRRVGNKKRKIFQDCAVLHTGNAGISDTYHG